MLHRQPRSPRMCIISPLTTKLFSLQTLRPHYVGRISVSHVGEGGVSECDQWSVQYNNAPASVCTVFTSLPPQQCTPQHSASVTSDGSVSERSCGWHQPFLLWQQGFRAEVLGVEILDGPKLDYWDALFDAQRASKAKCTAWN